MTEHSCETAFYTHGIGICYGCMKVGREVDIHWIGECISRRSVQFGQGTRDSRKLLTGLVVAVVSY